MLSVNSVITNDWRETRRLSPFIFNFYRKGDAVTITDNQDQTKLKVEIVSFNTKSLRFKIDDKLYVKKFPVQIQLADGNVVVLLKYSPERDRKQHYSYYIWADKSRYKIDVHEQQFKPPAPSESLRTEGEMRALHARRSGRSSADHRKDKPGHQEPRRRVDWNEL